MTCIPTTRRLAWLGCRAGSAPPQPRVSIGEADQLLLADIERIRTALAAPVKGRRHGNRAALQLRQLHGSPPLRRERARERGGLVPGRDGNLCHGLRASVDDG